MKKSNYEDLRRAWWRAHLQDVMASELLPLIEVQVARDVAAVEAVGFRWEGEFPVGLYFTPSRGGSRAGATTARGVTLIYSVHPDGDACLEEAVRRYNEFSNIAAWRNRSANV